MGVDGVGGSGDPGGTRAGGARHPRSAREPETPAPPLSDTELVARVRGGDDSAFEELYRRHAASIRRYARTCCRDAHTAEDLTGEVFVRTLRAIRGGSGPESAVRAYLLTTVRRVAASWGGDASRERLVPDFSAFALSVAGTPAGANITEVGADVLAMREADRSLAVRAFRTLPERWQAVLWHTAVEAEPPSRVAPLLGLTPNATAVLAHRAREGLRQAYLQAHVNAEHTPKECARYAERLGAHARGGLRRRADRELRRHLAHCAGCRTVAEHLADVNAHLRAVLPVAVVGWFAAAYAAAVAGTAAVGAAAAGAGAAGGAHAAGSAAGGLGAPVKAGIVAGAVVAAAGTALAATLVAAMMAGGHPAPRDEAGRAAHPVARGAGPGASPGPTGSTRPAAAPARPAVAAPRPVPSPSPSRRRAPAPPPVPVPVTDPIPSPVPVVPRVYRVDRLPLGGAWRTARPTAVPSLLGWWQGVDLATGRAAPHGGVALSLPRAAGVDLGRSCLAFDARAEVERLPTVLGTARFLVYGDGTLLYDSGEVDAADGPVPVHVALTGYATMRMVVRQGVGGYLVDSAGWAGATVSCR